MPAPQSLSSPCSGSQMSPPVPTLSPGPAPAGQQQWQAERQEQPQAGARHGLGDRLVAPGTGLLPRAVPTASRGRGYL